MNVRQTKGALTPRRTPLPCAIVARVPWISIDTLKTPIRYSTGTFTRGERNGLIYVSTEFAKYKWYATDQANVDNHRTRQLPPQKPMIKINISESDSNGVIVVRHAAGRHAICIIRTLYSRCNDYGRVPLAFKRE